MLVLGHDAMKREEAFKGLVSEDPQKPARGKSRIWGGRVTLNVCSSETIHRRLVFRRIFSWRPFC